MTVFIQCAGMYGLTPVPLDHPNNVMLLFLKTPENNILRKVNRANIDYQSNPELMCHNCAWYSEEKQQNIIIIQQKLIYGVYTYMNAKILARFRSFCILGCFKNTKTLLSPFCICIAYVMEQHVSGVTLLAASSSASEKLIQVKLNPAEEEMK